MKCAWRTLAAWSALGCMWAGTPVWADPPTADDVAGVEQYQGLKRVDKSSQAGPVGATQPKTVEPAPVVLGSAPSTGHTRPQLPAQAMAVPSDSEPGATKGGANSTISTSIRPGYEQTGQPSAPPGASKYEVEITPTLPAERSHASPRTPAASADPPYVIVNSPREVREGPEAGNLTAVSILAGALFTPLSMLAGIWIVVRFLQGRSGPLLRIEHIGGVYAAPAAPIANAADPNPATTELPTTPPIEETSTAHAFELGPTFEDERLAREQQAQQQEEGVLRQLFDDNVILQKQLKESHDDWLRAGSAEEEPTAPAESPVALT